MLIIGMKALRFLPLSLAEANIGPHFKPAETVEETLKETQYPPS